MGIQFRAYGKAGNGKWKRTWKVETDTENGRSQFNVKCKMSISEVKFHIIL